MAQGNDVNEPHTRASLGRDLAALGIAPGSVLLVHASLSRIGWVVGGAGTVIHALMDAVGPEGSLVMPTFSGDLTDPATWRDPPIPENWIETVRDHLPVFDPARTPTRKMGAIAEAFRTWPGVRRSRHPVTSLAAWGHHAEAITARHALAFSLGDDTPMGRIYELAGRVLLIGIGHERNSSLHLAETRARYGRRKARRMLTETSAGRAWESVPDVDDDLGRLFPALGAEFDATGRVRRGRFGAAECRLMAQRDLVDFAAAAIDARLAPAG
jgi:aminoglycoside 3-N-acetyltransferase